jgi:hypothetical protein
MILLIHVNVKKDEYQKGIINTIITTVEKSFEAKEAGRN